MPTWRSVKIQADVYGRILLMPKYWTKYYWKVVATDNRGASTTGPVWEFTTTMVSTLSWGSLGTGNGQFNWPNRVVFDAAGNIYVSEFGNNRIQKFNSNREFILKWGSKGNGNGQFWNPTSMAFDKDGNIYVVDTNNHRIQKFTSNGVFLMKFGSEGSGDGQFFWPAGIKIDSSGNIYISEAVITGSRNLRAMGPF
jgi:DNA-binding beta-propeller fold protein YncE